EFLDLLPIVGTIIEAINRGYIDRTFFINWTVGKEFEIKFLPPVVSLSDEIMQHYPEAYAKKLASALFTMASYMDYFLDQADINNLDVNAFNRVYGTDSLDDSYSLEFRNHELASILFMIISSVGGDFKDRIEFDPYEYALNLPYVLELIEEINAHPDYTLALNFFHNLMIPYNSDFSLNPKNSKVFDLLDVGDHMFRIARFIRERNHEQKGGYQDAVTYFEIIYKMYENWDEVQDRLEDLGEDRVVSLPKRTGFSYRILGGVVTIFMFDGYEIHTKVQPDKIARLTVSFIAEGKDLEHVRSRFSTDSSLIKDATQIGSIAVRGEPLDHPNKEATHTKYLFLPNGDFYYSKHQTYDALNGKLVEEVVDAPEGYRLISKPSYRGTLPPYYDGCGQPFFVPATVETYVAEGSDRFLYTRSVNRSVDIDSERLTQDITFYNMKGVVANQVTRLINLGAGNTLMENDEDTYTEFTYNSAFLEFLGLASQVDNYTFDGELLSRGTFDEHNGIKDTAQGIRLVVNVSDFVADVNFTREKDFLNKTHLEITNGRPDIHRETTYYYDNTLWAGFGVAHRAQTIDLITGIKVSESHTLEFNDYGGVSFYEENVVVRIGKFFVKDGKGRAREIYAGKDVEIELDTYAGINPSVARIHAGSVARLSYDDPYYRARGVASFSQRFAWDSNSQMSNGVIDESRPLRLEPNGRLVNQVYNPNTNLEYEVKLIISRNLVDSMKIMTEQGMEETHTEYNSLDIEMTRTTINARGNTIVYAYTLDSHGRPVDENGRRIYKYTVAKQTMVGTGVERTVKVQIWNGYDKEVKVSTKTGVERTVIEYNDLEVITKSTTYDRYNRTVFTTTAELDHDGKISEPYRSQKRAKAVQYNPSTGLRTIIITETATGLVQESRVRTLRGWETTENTYNGMRVSVRSVTRNETGDIVLESDAAPYLDSLGRVDNTFRQYGQSRADIHNPNTGLTTAVVTESATGLILTSMVDTQAGRETTTNTYNSLRVLVEAVTEDQFGNTVLVTAPELDAQGRVTQPYRNRAHSKARQENPNTGVVKTIITESATGLVLRSHVDTLNGGETTTNTYNSLRVLEQATTRDQSGNIVLTATPELDSQGRVPYLYRTNAESRAHIYNPNTGLITAVVTESATGLVVRSSVDTLVGSETTTNRYNSLRVLEGAVTQDQSGNTILVTTPELDIQGRVAQPYRGLAQAKAKQENPNTGLITEIITESATGLVIRSSVDTLTGAETTNNEYNSLRVLVSAVTEDQSGNIVLETTPDLDPQGRVAMPYRGLAQAKAKQENPNTGLTTEIITESATGLVIRSHVDTLNGGETTANTYNSLRVLEEAVTRDMSGNIVLITTPDLDVQGRVALPHRNSAQALAESFNPNTGLVVTIITESATGLVIESSVDTLTGRETTINAYNSLRVLTRAVTDDIYGNTVLEVTPDVDPQGKVAMPYRGMTPSPQSRAVSVNPNTGLTTEIITESATGLVLISRVDTFTGRETTTNVYNSLRVLEEAITRDIHGNLVLITTPYLDAQGRVTLPYRNRAQSQAEQYNPNTRLMFYVTTESATGLVIESSVNTRTGSETTTNTYNSLRVFTESITRDQFGRPVLLTDARPYLNAQGQIIIGLRAQGLSRADEHNPNTNQTRVIATEVATGLLQTIDVNTAAGRETTSINYNTLRVELNSVTQNARGVVILESRTLVDAAGRPVDRMGRRTRARYVKEYSMLITDVRGVVYQEMATGLIWHNDMTNVAGTYSIDNNYDSLRMKLDSTTIDALSATLLYSATTVGYNALGDMTEDVTDHITHKIDRNTSDVVGNLIDITTEDTVTEINYNDLRLESNSQVSVNLGTRQARVVGMAFIASHTLSFVQATPSMEFRLLKQSEHLYSQYMGSAFTWQEEVDNAGRVVVRYDGYLDSGNLEREKLSENIFTDRILGMVSVAALGNTFIYDATQPGFKGELFISSELKLFTGGGYVDGNGRTLNELTNHKQWVRWLELKDNRGRIEKRWDGTYDRTTNTLEVKELFLVHYRDLTGAMSIPGKMGTPLSMALHISDDTGMPLGLAISESELFNNTGIIVDANNPNISLLYDLLGRLRYQVKDTYRVHGSEAVSYKQEYKNG
ncbi:hypothetical protein ACFL96_16855, partial [Thermoproteota archaeon]